MAAAFQKLQLCVICAVLSILIFNKVADAYDQTKNCNESVALLQKCWVWHDSLQNLDCSNVSTTSLVKCGHIQEYNLQQCDKDGVYDFGWEGRFRQKLYKHSMEILCFERNFYKGFQADDNCWKQARGCAEPLIQIPKEASKEKSRETCQKVIESMDKCKSKKENPYRTTECSDMIINYVDRLFEKSKLCGASTLIVQISLIFVASIVTLTAT